MIYESIKLIVDNRGVATLTLNRPDVHNAMNALMWDEGIDAVRQIERDDAIRVVVLTGEGKSFCAGGDLKYQLSQRGAARADKLSQANKLATWLRDLDLLGKPLIGRIQGPAYAGGLGLISVCDIAISLTSSRFSITEGRLGLIPAMISPYVMRRLGVAKARRYFLNGRAFDAAEAVAVGLLDRAVTTEALDEAVEEEVDLALQCAPAAVKTIKRLVGYVACHGFEDNFNYTVERIADMWDAPEAIEGLTSFVEKRKPAWVGRQQKATQ
jgi:methylglutaconyl-CoA hydratase